MSTISRKKVLDAMRVLGLVPEDLVSVHINVNCVEAAVFAHNAKSVVHLDIVDDDATPVEK